MFAFFSHKHGMSVSGDTEDDRDTKGTKASSEIRKAQAENAESVRKNTESLTQQMQSVNSSADKRKQHKRKLRHRGKRQTGETDDHT